jgi:all-trans-retinol 13,14-reductase
VGRQAWKRRGDDYEKLKSQISEALIAFVENRFPGFESLIDYRELGTPITTEYFTNHRNGNIYGLPMVPQKFRSLWLGPYTPIRKLFLTGSDAAFFGIVGAMMSGVITTAVAMGRPWKVMGIVGRAIKFSKQLHAE